MNAAYTRWCEDSNEAAEKKRQFGVRLAERGFEPDNGAKNVAIRRGIALQHGPGPGGASDGPGVNQGGPKTHEKPSGAPGFGEKAADFVNRVNEHGEVVNPQNPCKSGDSEAGVNEGYPQSKSLVQNPSCSEGFGNRLTDVNSLTPRAENEHLTEDEVQSVRELVRQGMREDIAREEVFGKGWVPE
jgi:hypothetical protein